MSSYPDNFPHPEVLKSLLKKQFALKESHAADNGEMGDRLKSHYDANTDFGPKEWDLISKITYKGQTNELKAREEIRTRRKALDAAEALLDAGGHVGDIAEMASRAAQPADNTPKGSKPKDDKVVPLKQAQEMFEANAHKAPTPAEADAKAAKKGRVPAKDKDTVEEFRETLKATKGKKAGDTLKDTVAAGDAHIKQTAAQIKAEKAKQAAADPDDIEPPEPPRELTPDPDEREHGSFRIVS